MNKYTYIYIYMGYFLDNNHNQLPSALKHGLLFPGYNKHRTKAKTKINPASHV